MAQTQYVYGPQRGRIGNVVSRYWKRRYVQSIWQRDVHNPRTLKQRLVRARFAAAAEMFSPLTTFINVGLKIASDNAGRFGLPISPFNMAIKENFDNGAITFTDPTDPSTLTIDYSRLILSKGSRLLPTGISVSASTGGTNNIVVTWTDNSGITGNFDFLAPNDLIFVAAYNPDKKLAVMSPYGTIQRLTTTATINYPANWSGDTVEVFLIATQEDIYLNQSDLTISPTAYVGNVALQ